MRKLFAALFGMVLATTAHAQHISSQSGNTHPEFSWAIASISPGATNFSVPGLNGVAVTTAAMVSVNTTMGNLFYHVVTAPAAGESIVVTLMTGAPGSATASSVTCTVATGTRDCSDTTHTVAVAAGQSWCVRTVVGATNSTGIQMFGLSGTE